MTEQKCSAAATETASQSDSSLWFDLSKGLDLRYGRITASTLYDVAHGKKNHGVLVQQILGVSKFKATLAMNRAKQLEEDAITRVETKFEVKLNRIGSTLNPKYPIFEAFPDALCAEYILKIKCPQHEKNIRNYLSTDNKITAKYNAQVQLQMFLLNKKKCLFCLANPNFEISNT
nr:unnamed protein product [Callosobruchus chinensis]